MRLDTVKGCVLVRLDYGNTEEGPLMAGKGKSRMSFWRCGRVALLAVAAVWLLSVQGTESAALRLHLLDHFIAQVPGEVTAGVEFPVSITFVDSYGDPMADDWEPENAVTLQASRPASIQPPVLTAVNYVPGFTYRVRTEKAGDMSLFLRDAKGRLLAQWDLTVRPEKPEDSSGKVTAGGSASGEETMRPDVLDRIDILEDDTGALVTFSTNGMTDYTVNTSAKLSRKWIDIDFPSLVADLTEINGRRGKIVGEVSVGPNEGSENGVTVSVEILPARIGYDVFLKGQDVVLKVSKQ